MQVSDSNMLYFTSKMTNLEYISALASNGHPEEHCWQFKQGKEAVAHTD